MRVEDRQRLIEHEAKKKAKLDEMNAKSRKLHEKILAIEEMEKNKRKEKKFERFLGYTYDPSRKRYRVQFTFAGKKYRIGSYETHWEARAVYLEERGRLEEDARKAHEEYEKELEERAIRIKAESKAKKEAEDDEIYVPEDFEDYEEAVS